MFFITLQLVIFCAIVVVLAIGKGIYDQLSLIVPDVNLMTNRTKSGTTIIYSAPDVYTKKRVVLAKLQSERREWIDIEKLKITRWVGKTPTKVPGRLIDATLSIEDARFYTHPGMDAKRIAGAALANFKSGRTAQGGSTITEQLAVNIYLKRNKEFSRRLQTALLALQLERRFTKDEILEMYLNEIYYGNQADGCEAAARTYFNKSAADLTIAEAALLAGLPQQPTRLNPFEHFDRAKKRQEIVLKEMFENKRINYTQFVQAKRDTSVKEKIASSRARFMDARRNKDEWTAPYFVSYVKQYLDKNYNISDELLSKSGYRVYTTLDPRMQQVAEKTVTRQLRRLGGGKLQAALVCVDPWTGGVLAMVGGRDYYDTKNSGQFNRAVQAKRQPGSTFKPYVYAAAMEQGMTPNTLVQDSPLRVLNGREVKKGGHEIKNYTRGHVGFLPMYKAIGISNNVAATRVLMKTGIQNVIEKAHLLGIKSQLVPVPTLALGTSEISLLENTSAFGVFATRGLRAEETPIDRVENSSGEVIIETEKPVRGARVLSEEAGNKMWDMLRYVVTNGTGENAAISGVDVIGKTGTTSSNKDVWFMGATKQLSTGVWIGYDRPKELYGSSGGKWSAPLWRSFMVQALEVFRKRNVMESMIEDARATSQARTAAEQSKKFISRRICDESGLLATSGCNRTHLEQFSTGAGDIPTLTCTIPEHVTRAQQTSSTRSLPGDLSYDEPARNAQTATNENANADLNTGSADAQIPLSDEPIITGQVDTSADSYTAPTAAVPPTSDDSATYATEPTLDESTDTTQTEEPARR